MTHWDHRAYGKPSDPIRQSDLHDLAGASHTGCSKRFAYRKEAEASGAARVPRERAFAPRVLGSAIHETLRTYLTEGAARILRGDVPSPDAVRTVLEGELDVAREGLPIEWGKLSRESELEDSIAMVRGALADVGRLAAEIVVCEESFVDVIDCDGKSYHTTGTIDLAFVPKRDPAGLVLLDWKSGAQRLPQVLLDHGYQLGMYAHALEHGAFSESGRKVGRFPTEMYVVHLRDYVPYKRASKKALERPEELAWYGAKKYLETIHPGGFEPDYVHPFFGPCVSIRQGEQVPFKAGDARGPAWYRANRSAEDVARLKHSIRKIVSGVRLGVLYETIGEHCVRCPFARGCLTDGYVGADEATAIEAALRGVDGFDDGLEAA